MGPGTGRKALVAGGAAGLGREIAARLAADGARVWILDIDAERVAETVKELGDNAMGVPADVRSKDQIAEAVNQCVEAFGGLDTLVYSAGVFHMGPLAEVTEADWDRVLTVNLKGAFLTAQAVMPHLAKSGRGRIVTLSSVAGRRGYPLQLAYTASKFGIVGLTQSLAAEFARDGVTVNTICPVAIPTTPMGQDVVARKVERDGRPAEEIISRAAAANPVGRNATADDIAEAALFLISDGASFITGHALDVDGGTLLGLVPGIDPHTSAARQ